MAIAMPPRRVNLNALETRLRANSSSTSRDRQSPARASGGVSIGSGRPPSRGERGRRGALARSAAQVQGRRKSVTLAQRAIARSRDLALLGDLAPITSPLEVEV